LSPPKVKIGEKQTNEIHREKTQKGRRNKKPTGSSHPHRIAFSVLIFALSTPGKSKTTTATNQNQHNQLQQLFFSFLKIKDKKHKDTRKNGNNINYPIGYPFCSPRNQYHHLQSQSHPLTRHLFFCVLVFFSTTSNILAL
jgi:hypothetical protein